MPTVVDLQQLEALLVQLAPLANAQSGQRLRAEDWNRIVGAIIELAQAVLGRDPTEIVDFEHEHTDEVKLSWLDPSLRDLLQRGPLADPAGTARVSKLERVVERLSARQGELAAQLAEIRSRLFDVHGRDLVRENLVNRMALRVDGIADGRDDVLAVRQTLATIQDDLVRASQVAENLTVNGAVVDIASVLDRISEVEALRDRLTTPAGELFDATALEHRLTELTNQLVTEEELQLALRDVRAELPRDQIDLLQTNVTNTVMARTDEQVTQLAAELHAETQELLRDIDRAATDAVTAQFPELEARIRLAIAPEARAAAKLATDALRAELQSDLSALDRELRDQLAGDIAAIERALPARIAEAAGAAAARELANVNAQVVALSATQSEHAAAIARATRERTALAQEIGDRIADTDSLRQEFDGKLSALRTDISEGRLIVRTDTRLRLTPAEETTRLSTGEISATPATQPAPSVDTSLVESRLRGELRDIARDESTVAMAELEARIEERVLARLRSEEP